MVQKGLIAVAIDAALEGPKAIREGILDSCVTSYPLCACDHPHELNASFQHFLRYYCRVSVVLFWKQIVRDCTRHGRIYFILSHAYVCGQSSPCHLPCMCVLKRPIRTSLSLLCTYYYFHPNPQWFFSLPPITNNLSWIRTLQNVPR